MFVYMKEDGYAHISGCMLCANLAVNFILELLSAIMTIPPYLISNRGICQVALLCLTDLKYACNEDLRQLVHANRAAVTGTEWCFLLPPYHTQAVLCPAGSLRDIFAFQSRCQAENMCATRHTFPLNISDT